MSRVPGCDRCVNGYVFVRTGYVERLAPDPAPPTPEEAADPEARAVYDLLVEDLPQRRAALANSVYPCKDCLPSVFYRWATGHMARNHDRGRCAECRELDGRRPSKTRDLVREGPSAAPLAPLVRADLF